MLDHEELLVYVAIEMMERDAAAVIAGRDYRMVGTASAMPVRQLFDELDRVEEMTLARFASCLDSQP